MLDVGDVLVVLNLLGLRSLQRLLLLLRHLLLLSDFELPAVLPNLPWIGWHEAVFLLAGVDRDTTSLALTLGVH